MKDSVFSLENVCVNFIENVFWVCVSLCMKEKEREKECREREKKTKRKNGKTKREEEKEG